MNHIYTWLTISCICRGLILILSDKQMHIHYCH